MRLPAIVTNAAVLVVIEIPRLPRRDRPQAPRAERQACLDIALDARPQTPMRPTVKIVMPAHRSPSRTREPVAFLRAASVRDAALAPPPSASQKPQDPDLSWRGEKSASAQWRGLLTKESTPRPLSGLERVGVGADDRGERAMAWSRPAVICTGSPLWVVVTERVATSIRAYPSLVDGRRGRRVRVCLRLRSASAGAASGLPWSRAMTRTRCSSCVFRSRDSRNPPRLDGSG